MGRGGGGGGGVNVAILLMVLMPWQGIISMLMPGACLHDDAF